MNVKCLNWFKRFLFKYLVLKLVLKVILWRIYMLIFFFEKKKKIIKKRGFRNGKKLLENIVNYFDMKRFF